MKTGQDVLVMSRFPVSVRFIDVPSVKEAEIEKMVMLQAIKETPYEKSEIVAGYRNLGPYREGFSAIMLVIVRKKTIEEMTRGSKPDTIRLSTELLYLFLLDRGVITSKRTDCVIQAGREDSQIMIVDKGRLVFSRGFKNNNEFLDEIDRSIVGYQRDPSKSPIESVIVAYSSDVSIDEVRPHIKDRFNVPITFYEYKEDLTSLELDARIDLLPREASEQRKRLRNKQERLITFSLAGLIVLLFLGLLVFRIREKDRFLLMLSSRVEIAEAEARKLAILQEKLGIIKVHRRKSELLLNIMDSSYGSLTSNILLSGLDYNDGNIISYRGFAYDIGTITKFSKILEGLKYFQNVEIKYADKRNLRGEEVIDFNIQCRLRP